MRDAEQNTDVMDDFYESLDRQLKREKRDKTYFELFMSFMEEFLGILKEGEL